MRVILDSREKKLRKLFDDVEVQSLDVGDIMCKSGSDDVLWIAERKTVNDLVILYYDIDS